VVHSGKLNIAASFKKYIFLVTCAPFTLKTSACFSKGGRDKHQNFKTIKKHPMRKLTLSLLLLAASFSASFAQEGLKLPALSPTARISQDFSTSTIDITYSRPSMRGRKIFGDVVAYNEVWRTGANSATKVKFGEDVMVAGKEVKAGEYALYTIPGRDQWEVILNKGVGNWGQMGYDKKDDILRTMVKVQPMANDVQTFTIDITNMTLNSANIELMWEKAKVVLPVKANNEERLNAAIDKAINKPAIPYFQAANYYYETNQDLNKAMEYVNKALGQNPNAFYMYALKARIAQKQGDKATAIAAATQSMELAKGTAFEEEYKRGGQRIIRAVSKR
jgi:tetratricopeptide (TPR) repeat protein